MFCISDPLSLVIIKAKKTTKITIPRGLNLVKRLVADPAEAISVFGIEPAGAIHQSNGAVSDHDILTEAIFAKIVH